MEEWTVTDGFNPDNWWRVPQPEHSGWCWWHTHRSDDTVNGAVGSLRQAGDTSGVQQHQHSDGGRAAWEYKHTLSSRDRSIGWVGPDGEPWFIPTGLCTMHYEQAVLGQHPTFKQRNPELEAAQRVLRLAKGEQA